MEKKEYKLSKDAFKYLDSINIENNKNPISIKSIKIKTNLTLQIEKVEKIKNYIFSATLLDNDFRFDRFKLIFDKGKEIPKKGDIINIKQIEKCYNEKNKIFIYECNEIKFIAKEINFIVDISKIENYENIKNEININRIKEIKINKNKFFDKENNTDEEEEDEEKKEEEDDDSDDENDNNIIINKKLNNKNNINNKEINENNIRNYNKINIIKEEDKNEDILFENKNKFDNCQNYLVISNLRNNSTNFNIYLKCIKKYDIKEFKYKKNKQYQNYVFSDFNNEKIEAVSFDGMSDKFDSIIKINELYQINNCYLIPNNISFYKTKCPYKLFFTKATDIFNISKNKEIKKKFDNNFEIYENENIFLPFSEIINKKKYEIINIFGFVLKDYGNSSFYDKYNNEYFGRKILLGDDSKYKIMITFWHPQNLKKVYNEGELLYIQNIKVGEFKNIINLYSTIDSKIKNSFNTELDNKLKKYYSEHKDINEYNILKYNNNEICHCRENNKFWNKVYYIMFIKDILNIFNNKNIKNDKEINFKISAVVKKINHSQKNYYYGCNNCKKKMLNNICQNCGGKNKIIILHYSINVVDCSGSLWLLLFGQIAESFLGVKGDEYKKIIEKGISYKNTELNLLNNKIINNEYIFIGRSQYFSYSSFEGYRILVRFFCKKNKREYYSMVNYLNHFFK